MHLENNPVPVSVRQERHSGDGKQARSKSQGRYTERLADVAADPHLETRDADERDAAASRDVRVHTMLTNRHLLVPAMIVAGVAAWCITVMALGVNLAESAWEWTCVFGFGTAVPAFFLWQANRLLNSPEPSGPAPSARNGHKELLEVLAERGEITPFTAALRTPLTLDEAAGMLDELAMKNHLEVRAEEGVLVYALRERDRCELLAPCTASSERTMSDWNQEAR